MAKSNVQKELEEANNVLDTVGDLVDEALDPQLSREELVAKVKEIADTVGLEAEDDNGQD